MRYSPHFPEIGNSVRYADMKLPAYPQAMPSSFPSLSLSSLHHFSPLPSPVYSSNHPISIPFIMSQLTTDPPPPKPNNNHNPRPSKTLRLLRHKNRPRPSRT